MCIKKAREVFPGFLFHANYFINKKCNLFPCNIASPKQAGSWENTRVAFRETMRSCHGTILQHAILHTMHILVSSSMPVYTVYTCILSYRLYFLYTYIRAARPLD